MLEHPETRSHLWAMRQNTIIKHILTKAIALLMAFSLILLLPACNAKEPAEPEIDCIKIVREHLHYSTDLTVILTDKGQIGEFLALIDSLELRMPRTFWEQASTKDGAGLDYFTLMADGEIVMKYFVFGERYIKSDEKDFWPMMTDENYHAFRAFMDKYANWDQLEQ